MDTLTKKQAAIRLVSMNPQCQLVTVNGEYPTSRVMHTAKIDDDFSVWFATYLSSSKVKHIKGNSNVCVSWMIPGIDLVIEGSAALVTDEAMKDDLWREEWRRYFAGGRADPEYALIKVSPKSVKYRDGLYGGMEHDEII